MSQPEHVLVVGAGLGGLRTVEQLRSAGFQGRISLVGDEQHAPYDRPPLSKQVLTGEWAPERTTLRSVEGLDDLGVRTHLGMRAVALRPGEVELADGASLHADAIVVATGLAARTLPGQPTGVHTLRTLDDALALRAALERASSLLVIGGGFIGAEVASSARTRGLAVTVLEALPVPSARALGEELGALTGRLITEAGVELRTDVRIDGFVTGSAAPDSSGSGGIGCGGDASGAGDTGDTSHADDAGGPNSAGDPSGAGGSDSGAGDSGAGDSGTGDSGAGDGGGQLGVALADGTRVTADVVVLGIGGVPRLGWVDGAPDEGAVPGGLPCGATGRVEGLSGVWAVGDVAAWTDPSRGDRHRHEHWTSAGDQAATVARDILGEPPPPARVPYFWSDQFGLKIQLFGRPEHADTLLPLHGDGLAGGAVRGTVVGLLADGRLVAVAGFGAARFVARYRALLLDGADGAAALELASTLRTR
jgi:NADPH-dependent 2,4-dienoyl-CoA reductase/sulfur reductase-like enzyme